MDTPGLADETIQKEAALAITQGGTYKLLFMVRVQYGRAISKDVATLERVLNSIDAGNLNYKFTAVLNNINPRQYAALLPRGEENKTIKALVNRRYLTESFCFIPRIEALDEISDAFVELPHEVHAFLDNNAPTLRAEDRQVMPNDVNDFGDHTKEIRSELDKLHKDQAALQRTMREQEKRHDEAMQRMRASHTAQLERLNRVEKHPEAALSPRGEHDYLGVPLTPPSGAPNESILSRKKKLVLTVVAVVVMVLVIGISVVATQGASSSSNAK